MPETDLKSVAFPTLDAAQMESLAECTGAECRRYRDGDVLVRTGARAFKFFVVKSGAIEIVDYSGDTPQTVTTHGPGQFTGDISHLTGTAAVVSAIARGECGVYEIERANLRRALNGCPTISDIILQAFIARRQLMRESPDFTGLRVIGSRYSADTFRIRDFLARNRILFTWVDVESEPEIDLLLKSFGLTEADTPVVACGRMLLLRNPSNRELAEATGVRQTLDQAVYDLAIVGAGPAGLAAAVYGASEGLQTVLLERTAPGGQAGTSMRIENYLGFPTGITGADLAGRAILQAEKFGARLSVPSPVDSLQIENGYPVLRLEDGETVTARCLLVATGAEYRRLEAEGCQRFEGTGLYYSASPAEAEFCKGQTVFVVGGGNSAGQAAVFLAGHAARVIILIRGDDLYKSMSSYLVQRIEQTSNIQVRCGCSIRRMEGDGHLSSVEILDRKTDRVDSVETPAVFSFIGAVPHVDWLPEEVERDEKGFVRTGPDLARSASWKPARPPFMLETSRPGIFAAGDVRAGSAKRVASAVGEGAMAVLFVHQYLRTV